MTVLFRQTTIQGVAVGPRVAFDELVDFLDEHEISLGIDSTFRFEDAKAAYDRLAGGPLGKVVIEVR